MENSNALTFETLKAFLNSEAYSDALAEVNGQSVHKLDTRQLPDEAYSYTFTRLLRGYAFLNLSMEDVARHLPTVKHKLVPYAIACVGFFMKQPENMGDYPKGEERREAGNSEPIIYHGIAPTFLLDKIAELHLLEEGDNDRLLDYLTATRMPGAKQYARQITKLFNQIKV